MMEWLWLVVCGCIVTSVLAGFVAGVAFVADRDFDE